MMSWRSGGGGGQGGTGGGGKDCIFTLLFVSRLWFDVMNRRWG